jgi:AraC-like DNA-binding protein
MPETVKNLSDIRILLAKLLADARKAIVPVIPWVGYASCRILNPARPHLSLNYVIDDGRDGRGVDMEIGRQTFTLRQEHLHIYNVHPGNRSAVSRTDSGRCVVAFLQVLNSQEMDGLADRPWFAAVPVPMAAPLIRAFESLRLRCVPPGAPQPEYLRGPHAHDPEQPLREDVTFAARIQAATIELLSCAIDVVGPPEEAVLHAVSEPVRRALQFMYLHYTDRALTLGGIATKAGLSGDHFGRVFREQLGITPFAYLIRLRLEEAQRLLGSTDHRIQEIAREVGFSDPFHFSRIFRRQRGISPRRWRDRLAQESASSPAGPRDDS